MWGGGRAKKVDAFRANETNAEAESRLQGC